jgi:putative PIN family toxin of toxin-antitoxin system
MGAEPPRVVLDTTVLVAGLRSRLGASNALLGLVAEERIVPLVTTSLFLEYEEVLERPEHRLATGMSEHDIAGFLAAFASAAEPVEVHFLWRPQLADPDDELVLEAAVNGGASALITHNVRDFQPAAGRFRLEVVTPGSFLKRIRS